MIRHIVLFRWREDAAEDRRDATLAGLRNLRTEVPGVQNLLVGTDTAGRGTFHFALSVDFATPADLRTYLDHPSHKAVMAEFISAYVQPGPEVLDFDYEL